MSKRMGQSEQEGVGLSEQEGGAERASGWDRVSKGMGHSEQEGGAE